MLIVRVYTLVQVENDDNIDVLRENDIEKVLQHVSYSRPKAVIIDSIQTVFLPTANGAVGSVSQVWEEIYSWSLDA